MSILRLVRNFALLAVLALAAYPANGNHFHLCGGTCSFLVGCSGGCKCSSTVIGYCVSAKSH